MIKIKIVAPLTRLDEVKILYEAGAGEFYCGFVPLEWEKRHTSIGCINKKHMKNAQFRSFGELKEAIEIAHSYDMPVFLALNELYYIDEQQQMIVSLIERATEIGIDAFIVADPALLTVFREMDIGINLHMSTGGATFNSEAANFYREVGVSRIILPRHTTIKEAKTFSESTSGIELECIIMKGRAVNICGLCTLHHFDGNEFPGTKLGCFLPWNVSILSNVSESKKRIILSRLKPRWEIPVSCGACGIYDLDKYGFKSIKIAGRESSTRSKVVDVKFLNRIIEFMRTESSREEFRTKTREEFVRTYRCTCTPLRCHYASDFM